MAIGVEYEGGTGGNGDVDAEMEQMLSRKVFNSCRWEEMNAFMGSIQSSLLAKVCRLERVFKTLAMSVKVRLARALG